MKTPGRSALQFAFLGADELTAPFADIVAVQHQITGVCELDEPREGPAWAANALRAARQLPGWETLLDDKFADVVVVSRSVDEDRRSEQLRKLIQTGATVLVSHPVVDSMLVYYELDMIRRDTQARVIPMLPWRRHPAIDLLADMAKGDKGESLGRIEQLVMESAPERPARESVEACFARDVDLARAIVGDLTRLGAMASGGAEARYSSLGVQMSGASGVSVRWSVDPAPGNWSTRLSLLGDRGRAVLAIPRVAGEWTLRVTRDGQTEDRRFDVWNPSQATLDELEDVLSGAAPLPNWVDASRSVELTETIARSLTKGRTIELYYEDYTEQGTFKGLMASLGCGLLIGGLLLVALVAIGDQMGLPFMRGWPYLLAGVLGVFLLMQFLMFVFQPADARPSPETKP